MKTYTLENKPHFHFNDVVNIDMTKLGKEGIQHGNIVGKSATHVVDIWLIDIGHKFSTDYPYHVIAVPHIAIVDEHYK